MANETNIADLLRSRLETRIATSLYATINDNSIPFKVVWQQVREVMAALDRLGLSVNDHPPIQIFPTGRMLCGKQWSSLYHKYGSCFQHLCEGDRNHVGIHACRYCGTRSW